MRIKVVVLSLLIISLSIVSTTFVLLTLTSKNWSTQSYYTSQNAQKWTQSVCTAGRSPFYKCSVPKLATDGTTGKPSCSFSSCKYYKPFGFDQTSCRLPVEIGTTISQLFIDNSQECQQVHHAGNLQIAASCFIAVALILLSPLTVANVLEGVLTRSHRSDRKVNGRDTTRTSSSPQKESAYQLARHHSEEAARGRRRAANGDATRGLSGESQRREREAHDGLALVRILTDENERKVSRKPIAENKLPDCEDDYPGGACLAEGTTEANEKRGRRHCTSEAVDRRRRSDLYSYTPYVAAFSVCFLCIGAVLQVIAQSFGVLGLTLNASPTPDYISTNNDGAFGANSWVIGVALSTYATVAWTTALATAALTTLTYRLPRIGKLL